MNKYNFSTLNDKEFEEISKDLLNAKFNLGLQSFKGGKDKGVDLRYSTDENNNDTIVQVKHFINSKFSDLRFQIKNIEKTKIEKLKCNRYILVTSLDLSAIQKDELKKLLHPYVLNSNDIIAQNDLNDYLNLFPSIEKTYYKLWFSSTVILENLFNKALEGRTKYFLQSISNKMKFYVINDKMHEANEILSSEKVILITGEPGIGKSSLAEILISIKLKEGFQVYKITKIEDVENIISQDNNVLQLFYFDDFLGANYAELLNSYKNESQLTDVIDRIINTPNKFIILTTRTVVLNTANQKCEKIKRSSINIDKIELKLQDYSKFEKAKILYNHFYFNDIKKEFYDVILSRKFYLDIINHQNYSPRLIEFITNKSNTLNISPKDFKHFVINHLNNPKEIWSHLFNNQIEDAERFMLVTLFTFGNTIEESKLRIAFNERLQHEKLNKSFTIKSDQFNKSLKILQGGFLKSTLDSSVNEKFFSFLNPSIVDFLINFVEANECEKESIFDSLMYLEQAKRFLPTNGILSLNINLQQKLYQQINTKKLLDFEKLTDSKICDIIYTLLVYCSKINTDLLIFKYLKKITEFNYLDFSNLISILDRINSNDYPLSFNFIKEDFINIIESVIVLIDHEDSTEIIIPLFDKYNNYNTYLNNAHGSSFISEIATNILIAASEELIDRNSSIVSIEKVKDIYDELDNIKEILYDNLKESSILNFEFKYRDDHYFWEHKVFENEYSYDRYKYTREEYEALENREDYEREFNEDSQIEDLFS